MTNRPIRLSIVTPLYNEEQVCGAFFSRLVPILTSVSGDYEIICVNDGSRDRTLELLRDAHASNPRVKVIDLTRNFGKELALTAGLDHATGDAVIPIDVDLQDPPELIPEMVGLWQQGYDVVLAVRSDRSSDSPFKRLTANVFYRLMGHISEIRLPPNAGDFRLMDRRVVAGPAASAGTYAFYEGTFCLARLPADYRALQAPGAGGWHNEVAVLASLELGARGAYSHLPPCRCACGPTSGYSSPPLLPFTSSSSSRELSILGVDVPGYASLLSVILFFSGLNMIGLGIIGEYLGRVFIEVKGRPLYLVRETIGFERPEDTPQ